MSIVTTAAKLNRWHLRNLIAGSTLAVRIPAFLSPAICRPLAVKFLQLPRVPYTHERYDENSRPVQTQYGVSRIGYPWNQTYGLRLDHPKVVDYFKQAGRHHQLMRQMCEPFEVPMDTLIKQCAQVHSGGASVARLNTLLDPSFARQHPNELLNRPMGYAIVRIMTPEMEGKQLLAENPHVDSLPPHFQVRHQLSANVYLSVGSGGHLCVFPVAPLSPHEITTGHAEQPKSANSSLPCPVQIAPAEGDLIIINTRRPHAVTELEAGQRISIQSFIGHIDDNLPLSFWS